MKKRIYYAIGFMIFFFLIFLFLGGGRCHAKELQDSLSYYGNAFVKIKTSGGTVIYIDPYAYYPSDSADVILITHEHSDHNVITCVKQKSGCRVIRTANALIDNVYQNFTIGDITVKVVPAYNQYHLKTEGVGYVIGFNGIKVYHAGGTAKISEMADLTSQKIDYALYPLTPGPELMTEAAAIVQAKHDIPIHTVVSATRDYNMTLANRFTSPNKLIVATDETILLVGSPRATLLRVPQDYPTIQAAIDSAKSLDTVLVSEGVYYENLKFKGKGILLTSNYLLTKDWQTVFNTIIDGSNAANKDTASTVQFLWREDSTAVLDGFTIRGGSGTKYMFPYGTGTYAYQEGAGIILHYSSAEIRNNFITGNIMVPTGTTANGGGGAIASMYGSPSIHNNIIASNIAGYAGGIVLNWSGGKIKNNIVYSNTAVGQFGGGGIMVWKVAANTAYVENNTVVNNHSTTAGGGGIILNLLDSYSIPVIKNNIVWGNTQASGTQFTLAHYGNYNDVQDYSGGTNISADPNFLSGNNFMLSTSSPCIDAGDTSANCNDLEDVNNTGNALIPCQGSLRNDIGAYGGCKARQFPEFATVNVKEKKTINQDFRLLQNFPNPFNPSTTIRYQLAISDQVRLSIYDMLGREVAVLLDKKQSAGEYTHEWKAEKYPSGVYFYRLQVGLFTETQKLVLLK